MRTPRYFCEAVQVAFLDFLGGTGGGHVAWADSVATLAVVPLVLWERTISHAAQAMQVFVELNLASHGAVQKGAPEG
jgi:ABC-type cobalamin transport system permease subunit